MTWERLLIGLLTSAVATGGFCMLLKLNPRRIPAALLGGVLTNLIFDAVVLALGNLLLAAILSALFMALYSEISAKVLRAPAILFIVPCCIPIVPGSYLYYTGYSLLSRQLNDFWFYAKGTLQICLGIAVGMGAASMILSLVLYFLRLIKGRSASPRKE